ncbi:MAG: hypothetical protein JJ974_07390 [Phycisphaerales bacterium]|nr:hypothetical protein [Phycisphaerales bacterium]
MKTTAITALIAVSATLSATSSASAELITYQLEWSGEAFLNEASATGFVTLDTDLLPNPGFYQGQWEGSAFTNFSINVTGATAGNGTFSSNNGDFGSVIWNVVGNSLDLNTELMGQDGFSDFNVFSHELFPLGDDSLAPTGFLPFTLVLGGIVPDFALGEGDNGDIGDLIELVSMAPVPAPSSLALLGFAAITTRRRR